MPRKKKRTAVVIAQNSIVLNLLPILMARRDRGNDEGVGVFFKQSRMAKSKFDRCID